MLRTRYSLLFTAGLVAFTALIAGAADEAKVTETKGIERTSAATIDFGAAFELNFDTLTSLGARIEQARKVADPVGLATAANELSVAEGVSGKKASLTAEQLRKEAIELGKLRSDSKELTALAMLTTEAADDLKKAAAAAKEAEEDLAAAQKSGEQPKAHPYHMQVHNHSGHAVNIYHNGHHHGFIPAYGFGYYPYHGGHNHFYGRSPSHNYHHQHQNHHGHQQWHLH